MLKLLILCCGTWALAATQNQGFDYYDYADVPLEPRQPVAARPPTRGRAPARPQASRAPLPQAPRREEAPFDGPKKPPIAIIKDSRRIDTKTGAFVYEYEGADGAAKHEYRYPNGTVVGNYTFINDLGERETRTYSAGVFDPHHIDETTDPNYVDLGNYELYKHLEQPYVHSDGPSGFVNAPRQRPQQPRPRAPRPAAPRTAAPRPVAPRPPPFPLDFNDATTLFDQGPSAIPILDYEDVALAPAAPAPAPRRPPPRGASSRGRAGGRPRAPHPQEPRHRLNVNAPQSSDAILDSLIRQFQ